MYGLINLAIEEAILERYGQKFWDLIKQECRDSISDSDGTFISRLFYDDEVTYRLIDAAEKILCSDKYGSVSQLFGEKFYELVQDSGYEGILKLLGGTLKDFLDNLDSFHSHLSTTYSRMQAPSFRCDLKTEDTLVLHYYSERIGLEGLVMGMVKAAAKKLHNTCIEISIYKLKLVDQGIDHTEFMIFLPNALGQRKLSSKTGIQITQRQQIGRSLIEASEKPSKQIGPQQQDNLAVLLEEDPNFSYKEVQQLAEAANTSKISPAVFAQALPFHLIFDRNLVIRQAGTSILRVIPALNESKNVRLADVMNILEPKCLRSKLSFDNILKYINSIYVFRPDEKQVISSGHRHLHRDYLNSLRSEAKAVDGEQQPVSQREQDAAEQTSDTRPNATIAARERLLTRMESRERLHLRQDKQAQPSSDHEVPMDGCELPEKDIDKFIVKLKGQMTYMPANDLMLFICSPRVANLDDLNNTGLFLSDIPLHDATRDLVLLSEQFEAEYKVQKKLTMLTEQLNVMKTELEEEKKKTDRLLYSVLPPTVANELRNNRPVPAKRFQPVTILFSGIVGFSEFCARNSDSSGAIRIVNLLNKIYTTFDVLTEPKRNPYVYKVETVGDKYMAVSGLPEACASHARHINRLALDIHDLARTIKIGEYTGGIELGMPAVIEGNAASREPNQQQQQVSPQTASEITRMDQCEHLRVTIGVHCGEVVTGVIGKRTPRYCLFGNTVNLTSRCETTGKKGAINVSQDVYNMCTKDPNNFDPEFEFQYRGQINMKGKSEPMGMWFLQRRRL